MRATAIPRAFSVLLVLAACVPAGRRLLHVELVVGGKPVLRTAYEDSGTESVERVWGYLAGRPIMVDDALPPLAADADDPLRATLKGPVEVRFLHGGDQLGASTVTDLRLTRASATAGWQVPEAELARLRAAAR
jgi:hypothetical protein